MTISGNLPQDQIAGITLCGVPTSKKIYTNTVSPVHGAGIWHLASGIWHLYIGWVAAGNGDDWFQPKEDSKDASDVNATKNAVHA